MRSRRSRRTGAAVAADARPSSAERCAASRPRSSCCPTWRANDARAPWPRPSRDLAERDGRVAVLLVDAARAGAARALPAGGRGRRRLEAAHRRRRGVGVSAGAPTSRSPRRSRARRCRDEARADARRARPRTRSRCGSSWPPRSRSRSSRSSRRARSTPLAAVAALVLAPLGYWFSYRRRHRSAVAIKVRAGRRADGRVRGVPAAGRAARRRWTRPACRSPPCSCGCRCCTRSTCRGGATSRSRGLERDPDGRGRRRCRSTPGSCCSWCRGRRSPPRGCCCPRGRARRRRARGRRSTRRRSCGPAARPRRRARSAPRASRCSRPRRVFLAMPRLPGALVQTPPFSLAGTPRRSTASTAACRTPACPRIRRRRRRTSRRTAYPGFSDGVDLRARGSSPTRSCSACARRRRRCGGRRCSTRTTARCGRPPTRHRAAAADVGRRAPTPSQRPDDGRRRLPCRPAASCRPSTSRTQQPNVLFAAAARGHGVLPVRRAARRPLRLDPRADPAGRRARVLGGLAGPGHRRVARCGRRSRDGRPTARRVPRSCPTDLPARDGELAARITAGAHDDRTTGLTAVQALAADATRGTTSTCPAEPDGRGRRRPLPVRDAARVLRAHRERDGACCCARSGIPTRSSTGYGPGDRNPFTGYLEVRESDAHAWVEVFYPRLGWMPYDPTFGVPNASPSAAGRFIGARGDRAPSAAGCRRACRSRCAGRRVGGRARGRPRRRCRRRRCRSRRRAP